MKGKSGFIWQSVRVGKIEGVVGEKIGTGREDENEAEKICKNIWRKQQNLSTGQKLDNFTIFFNSFLSKKYEFSQDIQS